MNRTLLPPVLLPLADAAAAPEVSPFSHEVDTPETGGEACRVQGRSGSLAATSRSPVRVHPASGGHAPFAFGAAMRKIRKLAVAPPSPGPFEVMQRFPR